MATKLKKASIAIRQNKGKDLSPNWDGATEWSGEQFNRNFRNAMDYYRLEVDLKTLKPKLVEWMHKVEYPKQEIDAIRKTKDKYFNATVLGIAACLAKGMPESHKDFNDGQNSGDWLRGEIEKVVAKGADDLEDDEDTLKVEKAVAPVISIQDRVRDAAGEMTEELDYAIDSFIKDPDSFDPKAFKVINVLRGKGAKAAHTRYIKGFFKSGYEELLELASGNADEQLREGYSHLPRKNVKKLIDFYESIMNACDQVAAEAKVTKKPRAKKAKPAEQIVSKLKFCIKDDKLGIVSVPPAQIVGAQGVVVYNVKSRKIGYYVSKTSQGLAVKGTSLQDFTEKSYQKTLRKPAEQIKEFKDQNTQKRFEAWFEKNVKTTETLLNGRFNEDTVILKVFK